MRELPSLDLHGPRYLEAGDRLTSGAVAIFGANYDGTTSFRPGARFGPDAIRVASMGLESYSPELDEDLEDLAFADLGNLELPTGAPGPVIELVEHMTACLLDRGARPLMLGGEHSLSIGAIGAMAVQHPDLTVVQFDAHADLRKHYLGSDLNHACTMHQVLERNPAGALLQVGIRSGTREEFAELRGQDRWVPANSGELARRLAKTDGPIYLTVDLDVFDPALLPGTGTPEPGGIDWATFASLLQAIPAPRLIGADVVELAPELDRSGCSSVLAAKVVREIILVLGARPEGHNGQD